MHVCIACLPVLSYSSLLSLSNSRTAPLPSVVSESSPASQCLGSMGGQAFTAEPCTAHHPLAARLLHCSAVPSVATSALCSVGSQHCGQHALCSVGPLHAAACPFCCHAAHCSRACEAPAASLMALGSLWMTAIVAGGAVGVLDESAEREAGYARQCTAGHGSLRLSSFPPSSTGAAPGLALTHITLGVVHHVIRDCGMERTEHPTVWP